MLNILTGLSHEEIQRVLIRGVWAPVEDGAKASREIPVVVGWPVSRSMYTGIVSDAWSKPLYRAV